MGVSSSLNTGTHIVVLHIFREGNQVADAIANHGRQMNSYIWWDFVPSFCFDAYFHNLSGRSLFQLSLII